MSDLEIQVGGVDLVLLADRAILLRKSRALIVADVHWGKTATFRAASIPIPPGTTSNDLNRLTEAIRRTRASRLVVLGDLMHAKAWKSRQTHAAITLWRQEHSRLPITLVRGNHDLRAGDPTPDLGIEACSEPLVLEGLQLCHHPCTRDDGYTLAGHVHPCYTLFGPARQRERLPCFLIGPRTGLIPAFGSFTGMAPVDPLPGDRLFLVAGDDIVALPA